MRESILMFSGGPDSLIAWEYLKQQGADVRCIYVDLGHRYAAQEKMAIWGIEKQIGLKVLYDNRVYLGDMEGGDAHIPMRNAFLAQVGALYGDDIWIVTQKGELELADRSPKFFRDMSRLLSELNERKIIVRSPFLEWTKTEMVRWYKEQGLCLEALKMTSSCYTGNRCGGCAACFRRWVSFSLNGIHEEYKEPPWLSSLAEHYVFRADNRMIDKHRGAELKLAIELAKNTHSI